VVALIYSTSDAGQPSRQRVGSCVIEIILQERANKGVAFFLSINKLDRDGQRLKGEK
jgi:hypothetical protein